MPSVNEAIYDFSVRHQIGIHRLGTGVIRRIIAHLNAVDADLVAQILKFDPNEVTGAWSRKRIEAMLEAIRKINRDAYRIVERRTAGELKELAEYEVEFQARAIGGTLGFAWDIVQPSADQLAAVVTARPFSGKLLKEWVRDLENGRFIRLREAIRTGFTEGETVDKVVRRIRGTKAARFRDGVLAISRRSAEAMVRTAINHTATAAKGLLFEANSDLIKSVKWVSTLDSRTTPICQARDGKVYPLDSGPRPPAHINCRSTVIPITRSFRELGIDGDEVPPGARASMNGQVPQDQTYPEWLRKQPVTVQNEALGVTKAQLFRKGGLSVDRFIDTTGRAHTIAELRVREAEAFRAAGL